MDKTDKWQEPLGEDEIEAEEEKAVRLKEQLEEIVFTESHDKDINVVDLSDILGKKVHGHSHRHRSRYRKRKIKKIVIITACTVFSVFIIGAVSAFAYWSNAGKLKKGMFGEKFVSDVATMEDTSKSIDDASVEAPVELPDTYSISYRGSQYIYNEDMINVLFMGIDSKSKSQFQSDGVNSHQSDTLVLAAIDTKKKNFTIINIPRDAVTEIKVLDANMNYARSVMGPITIQHSFGDGKVISNELTEDAVSNLLYAIPIYRYVAMDMDAIPVVNDAVGGVTVEILDDMTAYNKKMKKGTQYTLYGKDAEIYVARRDTKIEDSSISRMKRQSQYMKALFQAGKRKTKENITFPVKVFMDIKKSIQTNLSVDEISFLAKQVVEMDMSDNTIETVPGELREIEQGEFENYGYPLGYVVDEEALKDMVIRLFYTKVEETE